MIIPSQASIAHFFYNQIKCGVWRLEAGARLDMVLIYDKGSPEGLEIDLAGEGAALNLTILALAKDREKLQIKIIINQRGRRSVSGVYLKGVAKDGEINAQAAVRIAKGAKAAQTKVSMKMLLTSPSAKAKPIPALEIEENEVIAAHEAAVGHLEEEPLFYLMSRGVDKKEAEKLLINGFIQDLSDKIKLAELKEKFQLCLSSLPLN